MAVAARGQQPSRPRLLQALLDAWSQPDVRAKLAFVFAMLVIFRFVAHIPIPGANADLLRQAFRVSTSGAPGPVHLELKGNAGQMLDQELDYPVVDEERFARYPAFRPEPSAGDIAAAADLLTSAKKPIIVAGGGVVASGAGPEVVKLAERESGIEENAP